MFKHQEKFRRCGLANVADMLKSIGSLVDSRKRKQQRRMPSAGVASLSLIPQNTLIASGSMLIKLNKGFN